MATVESTRETIRFASSAKTPFRNEPTLDFERPENQSAMREALERVRRQLGREYDNVIGGHRQRTAAKLQSINPSQPDQVVGIFQKAEAEDAPAAIEAALKAFQSWKHTSVEE